VSRHLFRGAAGGMAWGTGIRCWLADWRLSPGTRLVPAEHFDGPCSRRFAAAPSPVGTLRLRRGLRVSGVGVVGWAFPLRRGGRVLSSAPAAVVLPSSVFRSAFVLVVLSPERAWVWPLVMIAAGFLVFGARGRLGSTYRSRRKTAVPSWGRRSPTAGTICHDAVFHLGVDRDRRALSAGCSRTGIGFTRQTLWRGIARGGLDGRWLGLAFPSSADQPARE